MTALPMHLLVKLSYEPNGCLVFTGALDRGYGKARFQIDGTTRTIRVHRYVYEQVVGPVPSELDLDHLCRNRACANPQHLEVVTRSVNVLRAAPYRQARPQVEHGTTTRYARGCRCDICREAINGPRRLARAAAVAALLAGCASSHSSARPVLLGEGELGLAGTVAVSATPERPASRGVTPKASRSRTTVAPAPVTGSLIDTTCYSATGSRTASGKWPRVGMAASNRYPFGTRLHVQHVGIVVVEDRIGHGSELDLFGPSEAFCRRFGRQHLRVQVIR